jgi:hypothetical protein
MQVDYVRKVQPLSRLIARQDEQFYRLVCAQPLQTCRWPADLAGAHPTPSTLPLYPGITVAIQG